MFLKLRSKVKRSSYQDALSDEQLVAEFISSGNKELISILFDRYTHLVYGISLNYLQDHDQCKDAVMEIFEGLFQKLTEHTISNFRNWLYTVTKNHCLMLIRKAGSADRAKIKLTNEGTDTEMPYDAEEGDELMYSKSLILSALDQLNNEQGTCIRMMYIEDRSYKDISDATGYAMNEVKSHIQNGKRNMKNYLLKQYGNPNA